MISGAFFLLFREVCREQKESQSTFASAIVGLENLDGDTNSPSLLLLRFFFFCLCGFFRFRRLLSLGRFFYFGGGGHMCPYG